MTCPDCRKKMNRQKTRRKKKWISEGLCSACGGTKEDGSYSLCEKCRAASRGEKADKAAYRIEKGLCPKCGGQKDREGYYCSRCANKRTEYSIGTYHMRKSMNICPKCGKYSVPGSEVACPECRAADAERQAKLYEKDKEKVLQRNRESHKKRRERLISSGLCVRCGKRKPLEGFQRCGICRERENKVRRERYEHGNPFWMQEKMDKGICRWCDAPIDEGEAFCPKCKGKMMENMKKASDASFWRKDNGLIYIGRDKNE